MDNEVKGEGAQYDYGFRIYDPRIGRFLSVDPLTKSYPELTPYQFASNMPIACIDLDGLEAKVAITRGPYVNQSRTAIRVPASVEINVQIINLSSQANGDLNLDLIKSNLKSDLENQLSGESTYNILSPFSLGKSKNGVAPLDKNPGSYNFDVTYDVDVKVNVSVITDKSQIKSENNFVFGIVDDLEDSKETENVAGYAYGIAEGKVALGEAKYFTYANASKDGKNLIFHEIAHLLGADDIYNNPNKKHMTNAMNSLGKKNDGSLTKEQIVKEIWSNTIGHWWDIWRQEQSQGGYKQPLSSAQKADAKTQLEDFKNKQTN